MTLRENPRAYAIMVCAKRVHAMLGFGFLESAYGDAMEIEFAKAGIPYVREDQVRIYYDGKPLPTVWRADFTCFDREFIVELKAIKAITKIEWAQVVHYLRATRIPHALLVNFGRPALQYDTFDLDRLPSATSLDAPATCGEAAATKIPLQEESGSMTRSAGEDTMRTISFGPQKARGGRLFLDNRNFDLQTCRRALAS